jgi:expansin (peptidoglycan-binding protein)
MPLSRTLLPALLLLTGCTGCRERTGPRPLGEEQQGEATYYDATGAGACSFAPGPDALEVAALNAEQYAGSALCGACAEVHGPSGSVRVRLVDLCPGCKRGDLDLSREAFARVAPLEAGRVPVRWRLVTCEVEGPLRYHFKEGSNPWWSALQVRNHRLPISELAWWKDGAWVPLERRDYNYFVQEADVGGGPVRVRVTAQDGQRREDVLPGILPGQVLEGAGQFD